MKIGLGEPCHGWIDLTIEDSGFTLTDSISDVPDFIGTCVTAITSLLTHGDKQQIDLSLEPAYYALTLEKTEAVFFLSLELTETVDRDGLLHESSGSFDEIILPFFIVLQTFYEQQYKEPHWPDGNRAEIQSLVRIVEEHRRKVS